jgi:hypothetical protein
MKVPVNLAVSSRKLSIKEQLLQIKQSDSEFTEMPFPNRRSDGEGPKT